MSHRWTLRLACGRVARSTVLVLGLAGVGLPAPGPVQTEDASEPDDAVAALLELGGRIRELEARRDYASCLPLLEKYRTLQQKRSGAASWGVADTTQLIATLERQIGLSEQDQEKVVLAQTSSDRVAELYGQHHFDDALALNKKILTTFERLLGPDDIWTQSTLGTGALLLLELKRFEEAEPRFRQAIAGLTETLGAVHPTTLTTRENFARLLETETRVREEVPIRRAVWAGRRSALGVDDRNTLIALHALASALTRVGEVAEAQPLYEEVVERRTRVLGSEDPRTLSSRLNLATLLHSQGRTSEGLPILREILDIRFARWGPEHAKTLAVQNNIAVFLESLGQLKEAEETLASLVTRAQSALPADHEFALKARVNLGAVARTRGRFAEAAETLGAVYRDCREWLGAEQELTLAAANNLALAERDLGRFAEAEARMREVLAIRERTLGERHPTTIDTLNNLALILLERDLTREAEALLRRAVPLAESTLEADHPVIWVAQASLGRTLMRQGDFAEAEDLFLRSLAARRRVLPASHPDLIFGLSQLGTLLSTVGRFAEAELLFRDAAAMSEMVLDREHFKTALVLQNLGATLQARGRFEQALSIQQRAIEVLSFAVGPTAFQTLEALDHSVLLLRDAGRLEEAERVARQVVAQLAESIGEDASRTLRARLNLARVLHDREQSTEALRLMKDVAAIRSRLLGDEHLETLTSRFEVAEIEDALGRTADAETAFRQILPELVRQVGEHHPSTLACRVSLALNLYLQGQFEAAKELAGRAAETFEIVRRRASHSGLERSFFDAPRSPAGLLAICLLRTGRVSEAWESLERGQSRGLLDELELRRLQLTEEERRREHVLSFRLDELEEALDALIGTPPRNTEEEDRFRDLRAAHGAALRDWMTFETDLSERYDLAGGRALDLEALQRQLPPEVALLTWIGDWIGPDETLTRWALVLRSQGSVQAVELPMTRESESELKQLELALAQPPVAARVATAGGPTLVQRSSEQRLAARGVLDQRARDLSRRLIDPVRVHLLATDDLPAARHWIVVPGRLAGLPLEVLAPEAIISYAPSATIDARLRARDASSAAGSILAVGDPLDLPAANATPEELLVEGPDEPRARNEAGRLRAARLEVEAIEKWVRRTSVEGDDSAEILLGRDASEQALEEMAGSDRLRGFRWLHFATHAAIDAQEPMRSALLLGAPSSTETVDALLAGRPAWDGRLTVDRILRTWKLDADAVVLSACETGLGRPAGGEGYLGFAQALFVAGARSLVLSLWRVDDVATSILMARFYHELIDRRRSKAEALHHAKRFLRQLSEAQCELLREDLGRAGTLEASSAEDASRPFAHPHYWAGFVLIGESRAGWQRSRVR